MARYRDILDLQVTKINAERCLLELREAANQSERLANDEDRKGNEF